MSASDHLGRQWSLQVRGKKKDGTPVSKWVGGKVIDETDTHITVRDPRRGDVRIHKGNIVQKTEITPKTRTSRSPEDRDKARTELLGKIGEEWQRAPEGANKSDLDHLVKMGHIESEVRREFEPAPGAHISHFFGGAASVKRDRRYVRKAPKK